MEDDLIILGDMDVWFAALERDEHAAGWDAQQERLAAQFKASCDAIDRWCDAGPMPTIPENDEREAPMDREDFLPVEDATEVARQSCGRGEAAWCAYAGTEYCLWDCPFADSLMERHAPEPPQDHPF